MDLIRVRATDSKWSPEAVRHCKNEYKYGFMAEQKRSPFNEGDLFCWCLGYEPGALDDLVCVVLVLPLGVPLNSTWATGRLLVTVSGSVTVRVGKVYKNV